uniref:Uncharacterized protein n=1 Tax=Arundo donax TaxID=35708 RepID=A0A0A9BQ93_ARUDO
MGKLHSMVSRRLAHFRIHIASFNEIIKYKGSAIFKINSTFP